MDKAPKLTVITPVYNVEPYLRQCLDSIRAQTFTDWEAIIVDDGSTDGSGAVCDEYAAADPRFRVVHKENGGQSSARNMALDLARGEYLGFVDSDDWIEPDMYRTLVADIEKYGADIAKCGYCKVFPGKVKNGSGFSRFRVVGHDEFVRLVYDDRKVHSFLCDRIFRRDVFTVRLAEGVYFEDFRVMIELADKVTKVSLNPAVFYNYRIREDSTTALPKLKNRRDFIEGAEIRFRQVMAMKIKGLSTAHKYRILHKNIVKECRRVLRSYPDSEERSRFIADMRAKLASANILHVLNVGPKYARSFFRLRY